MTTVTFIAPDGTRHVVQASGGSLREAALDHDVPGILGDCGGFASCGTCHIHVDQPWAGRLPPPGPDEALMLEGVLERAPDSRLACQIAVGPAIEGLTARIPATQY